MSGLHQVKYDAEYHSKIWRYGPLFMTWGLFLETPENFPGPKCQLSNCNPLFLKSWCFKHVINAWKTKRIAKFDGLESRRYEDTKGIVAPEIDPKSFGTSEKQPTGQEESTDNGGIERKLKTLYAAWHFVLQ